MQVQTCYYVQVGQTTAFCCQITVIVRLFVIELMRKKFSKDLTAKGRIVWIVPKTKSIHWWVYFIIHHKYFLDNSYVPLLLTFILPPFLHQGEGFKRAGGQCQGEVLLAGQEQPTPPFKHSRHHYHLHLYWSSGNTSSGHPCREQFNC